MQKAPQRRFLHFDPVPISSELALMGAFARVFLAAGVGTTLQADLLAVAGRDGIAFWRYRLGCADVGLDSDFFGHGRLRVRNGFNARF